MTFLDWAFIAIVVVSMVVGAFRGFIKEAVSVGSLVIAVWAAFYFAPVGADFLDQWIGSPALKTWAARVAIFVLVLILGGLLGWAISHFANQVGLSSVDRTLGLGFGFLRGAIISGLIVIVGPYMALDEDDWWTQSKLLPYATKVAEGISIIAPRAFDYIREEIKPGTIPAPELPDDATLPEAG